MDTTAAISDVDGRRNRLTRITRLNSVAVDVYYELAAEDEQLLAVASVKTFARCPALEVMEDLEAIRKRRSPKLPCQTLISSLPTTVGLAAT